MRVKIQKPILLVLFAAIPSLLAGAQALAVTTDSSAASVVTAPVAQRVSYSRPTRSMQLHNYLLETFGPYPLVGSTFVAGLNQLDKTPPEWGEGASGYGRRVGSDFGIAAVRTSTRYAMATALKEDTLYYRCQCTGVLRRAGHAMISTLTGRRGVDGHVVFSMPSLVAPYVGTMVGVYGWYPDRYNAKDAFRMGNYSLLAYMGGNLALEFSSHRTGSLLARFHFRNAHGAQTMDTP
jgi:hypothetical protein